MNVEREGGRDRERGGEGGRERERERERDRQTDRQTETETDRQTDRDRDREMESVCEFGGGGCLCALMCACVRAYVRECVCVEGVGCASGRV